MATSAGSAKAGVAGRGQPVRAAFLDRDGVINVDNGFTYRPGDLAFTPTALEGIRTLNDAGYLVIVVTNQSGVARGLYREEDIAIFHRRMQEELGRHRAHIDAFYHCPYHPEGTVAAYARDHEDRKPGIGMLLRAIREWHIDREASFMIGDRQSDADAAAAAGIACRLVPANIGDLAQAVREMARL